MEETIAQNETASERLAALRCREEAEEERATAGGYRASARELRAGEYGEDRVRVEEICAEVAEYRAQSLDEQAAAHGERVTAAEVADASARGAAMERAQAAEQRARSYGLRADALEAEDEAESNRNAALADAAEELARAQEQRALAEQSRGEAAGSTGAAAEFARASARMHDSWAAVYDERMRGHEKRAGGDSGAAAEHDQQAAVREELALAAGERVESARHSLAAEEWRGERADVEASERERREAAEQQRLREERAQRTRERAERRQTREQSGLRRFRPGPGRAVYSPGMPTPGRPMQPADTELDSEIDSIARALREHGPVGRDELARLVGARYWGPGRFRGALREAVAEDRARELDRNTYAPPEEPRQEPGDDEEP